SLPIGMVELPVSLRVWFICGIVAGMAACSQIGMLLEFMIFEQYVSFLYAPASSMKQSSLYEGSVTLPHIKTFLSKGTRDTRHSSFLAPAIRQMSGRSCSLASVSTHLSRSSPLFSVMHAA